MRARAALRAHGCHWRLRLQQSLLRAAAGRAGAEVAGAATCERIALAVAGPMDVFIRMTRPAVRLMNRSAALVLRLFRAPLHGEGQVHSPEELKMIATATRRMGLLPCFRRRSSIAPSS